MFPLWNLRHLLLMHRVYRPSWTLVKGWALPTTEAQRRGPSFSESQFDLCFSDSNCEGTTRQCIEAITPSGRAE
jgi:hypothetical protein